MSRWSLGWTAMPVRSGPTLPPSPECVWHLAQCLVKTTLPAIGVAGLLRQRQQLVDDLLPVGVGQAAAAREQRLGPRGDRAGRGGRPGPASGRASARRAAPCPSRAASSRARVPSGRPSSSRSAAARADGGQRRQLLRRRPGRRRPPRCAPTASSRPAASSGDVRGVTSVQQLLDAACSSSGRNSISCRAAATRAVVARLVVARRWPGSAVDRLGGVLLEALAAPGAWPAGRRLPVRARRQPRRAARTIAFSCPSVKRRRLALRPALGQAGDDGLGDRRRRVGQTRRATTPTVSAGPPRA